MHLAEHRSPPPANWLSDNKHELIFHCIIYVVVVVVIIVVKITDLLV